MKRFIAALVVVTVGALFACGCASTTAIPSTTSGSTAAPLATAAPAVPTAAPSAVHAEPTSDVSQPEAPTTLPAAQTSPCGDNVQLFGGSSGSGFNASGETAAAVRAGICLAPDGSLQLELRGHDSGEHLTIPACQQLPDVWQAQLDDAIYTVVDERNSQRAIAGILQIDPFITDQSMEWQFESDIVRATLHQNRFDAPMCAGSQRLCTTSVGSDETLNLRAAPSLDSAVVASVPGGSCGLWQYEREIDAVPDGWATVVFAPDETSRVRGYVSTDFTSPAPSGQVVDVSGVANVPFGAPWPYAIAALTAQLGEPESVYTSDVCGIPGDLRHDAEWDNLLIVAHAPVDGPPSNPPVLTFATVGSGRFSATGGLQGGASWGDFVAVFSTAAPFESLWTIDGRSQPFDEAAWFEGQYLTATFPSIESLDEVDAATPLAAVSAGKTWADC